MSKLRRALSDIRPVNTKYHPVTHDARSPLNTGKNQEKG